MNLTATPSTPWALELNDLCFSYNGQAALEQVNLRLPAGEFLAVLGPNGGGKTTLLRLILGLVRPQHGSVQVFGGDPEPARRRIGYVPQLHTGPLRGGFPVRVLDAVLMGYSGGGRHGWRHSGAEKRAAAHALEQVGLVGQESRRLDELSGGQAQRAAIARALVCKPDLLLMDEPTANIDPQGRFCFYEFLAELGRQVTVVVVSHDVSVLGAGATCVACVNRRLIFSPTPELTPEMLELLYGVHRHTCPMDTYINQIVGQGATRALSPLDLSGLAGLKNLHPAADANPNDKGEPS